MKLYLDCDGVLADFERGAHALLGMPAEAYQARYGPGGFWKRLARAEGFYTGLGLLPDAMELFQAVEHLRPAILTGVPVGKWAEPQKRLWTDRHFPGVEVIVTLARKKHEFCRSGDVLVDDRDKYRPQWEQAGGVFIHHRSAQETLAALGAMGVLAP